MERRGQETRGTNEPGLLMAAEVSRVANETSPAGPSRNIGDEAVSTETGFLTPELRDGSQSLGGTFNSKSPLELHI